MITLIAAMSRNRVIGYNNRIPWHLPADLAFFHDRTVGKPVIMGRRTYESIGHALSGRTNIVLTRNAAYDAPDCIVVHAVREALHVAGNAPEIMIIGGEEIYREFLPIADRIDLTIIDADVVGDTYFPESDFSEWKETRREPHEPDRENEYRYTFFTYERIPNTQTPHRLARA